MRALISVHDVFPDTMPRVERIVADLRGRGHDGLTLLVTPGLDWHPAGIERLRRWQSEGIELAAHGWCHEARAIRRPFHRMHAAVISRNAAEHLALEEDGIISLMQAAHGWFADHGLHEPTTYVPPAWALGRIGRSALARLPYRRIEVTRGLIHPVSGALQKVPLVGFEADTPVRAAVLRRWNRVQVWSARRSGSALRIAIHPYDPELRLADDLRRMIAGRWRSLRYDRVAGAGAPIAAV
jgi:predicted deacetylase